jgi:tetratricopeptide (TPR) repeat protein
VDPYQFIELDYSYEDTVSYIKYMTYANINDFLAIKKSDSLVESCARAYALFSEDTWSLYWTSFYQMQKENYREALAAFNILFETDIAYCMEILPLAYRMAALCAGKLGDKEVANYYHTKSLELYNEHAINVSGYYYTGHLLSD